MEHVSAISLQSNIFRFGTLNVRIGKEVTVFGLFIKALLLISEFCNKLFSLRS